MWILSYIGSTWALILVVILLTAGLAAIAFFTHNWRSAIAAGAVLAAGFAYQQIDKNAYQRRVDEEKAAQVEELERRINVLNAANEQDGMRSLADADRISHLEELARAKPPDTPRSRAVALDRAAAQRVRAIRDADGGAAKGRAAAGASGHSSLFSWRYGRRAGL